VTVDLPPVQICAPWVAPTTMRAVLQTESAMRPLAIGTVIRRGAETFTLQRQPRSRLEAEAWARWLLIHGYRFDAGIAQVHSTNFAAVGLTPQSAFETCASIAAGGAILTRNYLRAAQRLGPGQAAIRAALSAYNTGSFTAGLHNGYVARVERATVHAHTNGVGEKTPGGPR
jgi:type IV secretion system protein VirB1